MPSRRGLTACLTCAGAGYAIPSDADSAEAWIMLVEAAESPASGARFVRLRQFQRATFYYLPNMTEQNQFFSATFYAFLLFSPCRVFG